MKLIKIMTCLLLTLAIGFITYNLILAKDQVAFNSDLFALKLYWIFALIIFVFVDLLFLQTLLI